MRIYAKNIDAKKEDLEEAFRNTAISNNFSLNKDTYTIIPEKGEESFTLSLVETIAREFMAERGQTIIVTKEK